MKTPRVEVVCVGTELLTGKVNTHVAYLGEKLATMGLAIAREHTIGDDPAVMREVFSESFRRSDLVLCAGGLGPTFDDLTRDVWSRVLKRPLKTDPALVRDIQGKFRDRHLKMPPANRRQAQVLKGAQPLSNPNGTAPGQIIMLGKKTLVLLPGPSRELYPMMDRLVIPQLRHIFPGHQVRQKIFLLVGVPESQVDHMIRPLVNNLTRQQGCRIVHGILASQSIISVKFQVFGQNLSAVEAVSEKLAARFRKRLGDAVFGEDHDTLESCVGRLLKQKRKTIAVAESCTGGLIAKSLTDVAGSSDYFIEGAVAYSNASKARNLGVPKAMLARWGAVSTQVAKAMAAGLRRKARTDFAVSTTGIAGPGGATPGKPVGLVYIGVASSQRVLVREFRFTGDRGWIRHRATLMALDLLRRELIRH